MVVELKPLIDKVWRYCESADNRGRTVTLKVKFNDFETGERLHLERSTSQIPSAYP